MKILSPLTNWNRRRLAKRRAAKKKTYPEWVTHYDIFDSKDIPANARRLAAQNDGPLISIVAPLRARDASQLQASIESIKQQWYSNWELRIAFHDDATVGSLADQALALAQTDPRIKCVAISDPQQGLVPSALPHCTGSYIAVMENSGVLPRHSLLFIGKGLMDDPGISFLYVDEDEMDSSGNRLNPKFKPDWNEYLLRSQNYIGPFFVFKATLRQSIEKIPDQGSAAGYDLVLRCTEQLDASQIAHIPFVLYHSPPTQQMESALLEGHQKVLQEHYQRTGVAADTEIWQDRQVKTTYQLPQPLPAVSIIIPSKDRPELLEKCVSTVLKQTHYPNFEIVFVDNGTTDPLAIEAIHALCNDPRFKVIKDASPFNYSRLNNLAVSQSHGAFICLMNNDVEITDPNWLTEMVSVATQPEVGAVGARLLYPDTSLQHVGVIVGLGGVAGHAFKGNAAQDPCYMDRAVLVQEYSAVTAACLLTSREVYERVGGLNEADLTIAFNDIDYCLKVRELGKKIIYTPYAEFIHHESASRGKEDTPQKKARFAGECQYMKARWGHWFSSDPAYNPNLTNHFEDCSLATPPRATHQHFLQTPFSASAATSLMHDDLTQADRS